MTIEFKGPKNDPSNYAYFFQYIVYQTVFHILMIGTDKCCSLNYSQKLLYALDNG